MKKKDSIAHRIDEARKEIENWPDWMKAAARFEGSERAGEEPRTASQKVKSKPAKEVGS